MAGAFSGRLVNSYQPNNPFNSSIVTHESMSFNPSMHGTPFAQQSFSLFGSQPSFANDSINEETAKKIASLQVKLNQKLGPEFISQRPGPGGGPKLTYAEGWKVINLANEVFGFNGWSSSIVSLTTDFIEFVEASGRYNVGVTAIVRVTLRDGTFHEDIGYGLLDNGKQKGAALDKSKKEAVTDAIKRALRNFGNVLGNCLYDKSYTSEVVKIKVPPVKFKKEELHRLPEFDDVKLDIASMPTSTTADTSTKTLYPRQCQVNVVTPTRPPLQKIQTEPLSSIPAHIRSEITRLGSATTSSTVQTDVKGKGPAHRTGLITPITTPITTSLHHPLQRPNLNPPQATSTELPAAAATSTKQEPKHSKVDSTVDESFGFNSDDDVFFALADLGPPIDADETDVGRPINSDEGRPIDLDEGLLGATTTIEDDVLDQQHQQKSELPTVGAVPTSKLSRREMILAALMSAEHNAGSASTSDSLQGRGNGDERQPSGSGSGNASDLNLTISGAGSSTGMAPGMPSGGADTSLSISGPDIRPPVPLQPQQNQQQNQKSGLNLTSIIQQRHHRHMAQNQNDRTGLSSGDRSKRSPIPSIGGFHFPPGINPLQKFDITTSTSSIGFKRPAEAMASNANHTNKSAGGRPGIGMGLQQSISGPGVSTGTREVLGRLEVGEGGNVKRIRR